MKEPVHLDIIEKIPNYWEATKNLSKKKIQEIMREYEFDDDYVDTVDYTFCQGFDAARHIIIEMFKKQYWGEHEAEKKRKAEAENTPGTQKTVTLKFKNKAEEENFMAMARQAYDPGAKAFNTPAEAFANEEARYRVDELIDDAFKGRPEIEWLLQEMYGCTESDIAGNIVDGCSDYPAILNGDTLEQIAIDNVLAIFKERLGQLSGPDREAAEAFIAGWDDEDEDGDEDE